MNVLILHGIQGKAGENWTHWLSDSLTAKSYNVIMPTLPNADHPDRTEWLEAIKQITRNISDDLIIVAHSLGVTSALDFIEQSPTPINGLVSVSGFANDYGFKLNSYFLKERKLDFDKINNNLGSSFVYYGDNDPYVTQEALAILAKDLKVKPTIIKYGGHLNKATGFTEFPQLLEAIESIK